MPDNLFFTEAKETILRLIAKEYPAMPEKLITVFINNFSKFCTYEEEGQKVKPKVIFTNNIESVGKHIPSFYKLQLFSDKNEEMFYSRMKSTLIFCMNDWTTYIECKDGMINYGICNVFNSFKDKPLSKLIFENDSIVNNEKLNLIYLDTLSTYAIDLRGIKGGDIVINFSINDYNSLNRDNVIERFSQATFSKLKTTKNKLAEIKVFFENIMHKTLNDIHGAICVVIDKDYEDKGFFSDGIWLDEPIEFSKTFLMTKSYSEAKLNNIAQLFISMLNYDGITILDNAGRIRAYNVFIKLDQNASRTTLNAGGGARKRAAYAVINSPNKKVLGVYFQSQEGEIFFQEVKR